MPESMKLFNKLRPRDINLELGVAENENVIDYYVFNETALNSFSKQDNMVFFKDLFLKIKY